MKDEGEAAGNAMLTLACLSQTIYVQGYEESAGEAGIRRMFERFGEVNNFFLPPPQSWGIGWVGVLGCPPPERPVHPAPPHPLRHDSPTN